MRKKGTAVPKTVQTSRFVTAKSWAKGGKFLKKPIKSENVLVCLKERKEENKYPHECRRRFGINIRGM